MCLEGGNFVIAKNHAARRISHRHDGRARVQVLRKLDIRAEGNLQPVGVYVNGLKGIAYLRGTHTHVVRLDGQRILGGCRPNRTSVRACSYCRTVFVPFGGAGFYTGSQDRRISYGCNLVSGALAADK